MQGEYPRGSSFDAEDNAFPRGTQVHVARTGQPLSNLSASDGDKIKKSLSWCAKEVNFFKLFSVSRWIHRKTEKIQAIPIKWKIMANFLLKMAAKA